MKSTKVDHHWGYRQGANAYINKPFHPKELLDTVKLVLKSCSNVHKHDENYLASKFEVIGIKTAKTERKSEPNPEHISPENPEIVMTSNLILFKDI